MREAQHRFYQTTVREAKRVAQEKATRTGRPQRVYVGVRNGVACAYVRPATAEAPDCAAFYFSALPEVE